MMYLAVFGFKIAIIVSIRYVFWAAGMPKMLSCPGFLPGPHWQSLQRSLRLLSCCLLLFLNIAGDGVVEKCFWGLESHGIICDQENGNPACKNCLPCDNSVTNEA